MSWFRRGQSTGAIAQGTKIPAGTVFPYAGSTNPNGYLGCSGQVVSRTTYSALFEAIGTAWGVGDGSGTFGIPDFRGRNIIGVGQGAGLTNRVLGASGGAETHTLTVGEMPTHTHSQSIVFSALTTTVGVTQVAVSGDGTNTTNAGSGVAHNIMSPFATCNYIIKT